MARGWNPGPIAGRCSAVIIARFLRLACIIFFAFMSMVAHAADVQKRTEATGEVKIAILDLRPLNVARQRSDGLSDLLNGKLYESRAFRMIESTRIKAILKELGIIKAECDNVDCAVKFGKILGVQKIIIGSMRRDKDYLIEVQVVDVAESRIDGTYSSRAAGEAQFDAAAQEIVDKILGRYEERSSANVAWTIGVHAAYLNPLGDFSLIASSGYGGIVDFSYENMLIENVRGMLSTGYLYFKGSRSNVQSLQMIPAFASVGYSIPFYKGTSGDGIVKRVYCMPAVGAGYLYIMMSYDTRIAGGSDYTYNYGTQGFFNPGIFVSYEIGVEISGSVAVTITPSYTWFFERNYVGQYFGGSIGVRFLF